MAILGKLEMLETYPVLTFDLLRSCFPLVFSSLANGHSPWAGCGQVIYLLYYLNEWHCFGAGQPEENTGINLFAKLNLEGAAG